MSTIDYYDQNAQEYYERTVDADLAEIREYFLGFLRRDARILDFGCGSGRDAKAFAEAGRILKKRKLMTGCGHALRSCTLLMRKSWM